jgi:glutamate synthase (NADPH/NADH) small chain
VHRRLPGEHRHPALHPPPAGPRPRRRAGRHQRVEPVPLVCGRVCPQESQCEAQCIVRKEARAEAVGIGRLERSSATTPPRRAGPAAGVPLPRQGRDRRLRAPPGLATAADLAKAGADVTVYEALHVVGGVLRYGIPSFRLPRDIIDREVQGLRDLGVKFETNKVVGKTFTSTS